MTLLGFTKLKEKLLDGSKTQTIRKPRKRPIKEGDVLQIYWKLRTKECEKLGVARATKIQRKRLADINNEDAVKDGVKDLRNFRELFRMLHPKAKQTDWFDIITFEWDMDQQLKSGRTSRERSMKRESPME